jgi:Tfp pilus assembly protein PilN
MKRLAIDFAPRTLRRSLLQTHPLAWLCGLLGLALCAAAALTAHTLADKIDAQGSAMRRIQTQLSQRSEQQPVIKRTAISEAQAAAINAAIAQLNLPWREVFDAIESATPKTIALLALQPDAKRNLVKGVAEAKTSDDMIGYIALLKKQEFFTAVLLTKHEVNEQDPNKPLRFQFEAQWAGAAP